MNKKFLSAVLFGALLASTTGTFTSCKDYDDDINGLSERVDAIEKTLADLNTKFGSLAYVKSVSFAGGELVVTDQDGKPERFSIPDKNTTYSLEINQSTEGDATTVTVILKDGDGKVVSSKSFTLTDKDTITEDTTLDPSLFWMDESGVIWYGLKTDKDNCIKTGVTVPLHEKNETSRWMGACEKLLPRPQRASRFRFARWINRCLHLPAASCRPKDWPVSSKYCDYG